MTVSRRAFPYIVGNEGAERFSFYGMSQILYVYLAGLFSSFVAEIRHPDAAGQGSRHPDHSPVHRRRLPFPDDRRDPRRPPARKIPGHFLGLADLLRGPRGARARGAHAGTVGNLGLPQIRDVRRASPSWPSVRAASNRACRPTWVTSSLPETPISSPASSRSFISSSTSARSSRRCSRPCSTGTSVPRWPLGCRAS